MALRKPAFRFFEPDSEDRTDQPGFGRETLQAGCNAGQSQFVQRIGDDAGIQLLKTLTVVQHFGHHSLGATAFLPSTVTAAASTSTIFLLDSTTTTFFSGSEK